MDIHEAMRTTFAAREFTDEPLPDDVLFDILDRARFAPSGGNRQGWHVIVVRDRATREALAALATPAAKRYTAQREAGENPWNPVGPTSVDAATAERTPPMRRLIEPVLKAAVVLVVCVDLKVVACLDQYLDRVGLIGGASVYPFVWNILLAARARGFGGTITTLAVAEEPKVQPHLGQQLVEALVLMEAAADLVHGVGIGWHRPRRSAECDRLNAPRRSVVKVDEVHQHISGLPSIDSRVGRPARPLEIGQGLLHHFVQIGERHFRPRHRRHRQLLLH